MIVDDSLSRLTTRMSFWSAAFLKARRAPSRGSAAASEIRVYIEDDNQHKENIEDQDDIEKTSSNESVNSQELEETPQKRSVSLNVHRVRWAMWRDGVMT